MFRGGGTSLFFSDEPATLRSPRDFANCGLSRRQIEIRQAIHKARATALELGRKAATLYDVDDPAATAKPEAAMSVAARIRNRVKGWKK